MTYAEDDELYVIRKKLENGEEITEAEMMRALCLLLKWYWEKSLP